MAEYHDHEMDIEYLLALYFEVNFESIVRN